MTTCWRGWWWLGHLDAVGVPGLLPLVLRVDECGLVVGPHHLGVESAESHPWPDVLPPAPEGRGYLGCELGEPPYGARLGFRVSRE